MNIAPPTGAELDAALTPIRHSVVHSAGARRRTRRYGFAVAGAAAALSTALVAANIFGFGPGLPGSSHGASAEAAGLLHHAETTAIGQSDPVVGPDQYLRVTTVEVALSQFGGDSEAPFSAEVPETRTLYVPSDRSSDWVWVRKTGTPTMFYPQGNPTAARAAYEANGTPYPEGIFRAKDGAFYGDAWNDPDVANMPTEPRALLAYFNLHYAGGSASREDDTMARAADLLNTGTVPAKLRAAVYGMLALVPGVTVTDDAATIDGRQGVAIGRVEPKRGGEHVEFIIDPTTGELIGSRTTEGVANGSVPAGTVFDSTSITTAVVDSAP